MSEIYIPSVDVCSWCTDSECDGIGCIANLDPNNPADHDRIDELHATLRAGQAFIQANKAVAQAEGREAT